MIINELSSLLVKCNLRLNIKKSEVLTGEEISEIGGVKCSNKVKCLGVRVAIDRKKKISKDQKIHKNTSLLRWKLKGVEPDVLQQLTCCLARSLLIFI